MYYFGTNLESRFSVPGFWPTQEQSHKIPFEKEEIKAEIERGQKMMRERQRQRQSQLNEDAVRAFAEQNRRGREGETGEVKETA